MKPQISEFSYGYALTEALIGSRAGNLQAAPLFPSLLKEGALGFDLELNFAGYLLFIQFKLADQLKSPSAKAYRMRLLDLPYHQFALRATKLSDQHILLLRLEAARQLVFYAAPAFYTMDSLNKAYLAKTVASQSIFISPSALGAMPDDKVHHVVFSLTPPKNRAFLFSSPREVDFIPGQQFLQQLSIRISRRDQPPLALERLVDDASENLVSILRDSSHIEGEGFYSLLQLPALERVAYLSRTYFGCEPFLVRQVKE